jgi:hypothetical protein
VLTGARGGGRGRVGLGEAEVLAVESVVFLVAEGEQRSGARHDALEDRRDLGRARGGCAVEVELALVVRAVGPVEEEAMRMHVEPEVAARPMDGRHRAASRIREAGREGEVPIAAADLLVGEPDEGEDEVVVEGEPDA